MKFALLREVSKIYLFILFFYSCFQIIYGNKFKGQFDK